MILIIANYLKYMITLNSYIQVQLLFDTSHLLGFTFVVLIEFQLLNSYLLCSGTVNLLKAEGAQPYQATRVLTLPQVENSHKGVSNIRAWVLGRKFSKLLLSMKKFPSLEQWKFIDESCRLCSSEISSAAKAELETGESTDEKDKKSNSNRLEAGEMLTPG